MENLEKLSAAHQKEKASSKNIPIDLNPEYTFDNFVVGNSNRFAHAL
jgi:chromosomal replication initiation ATPase DnaA